jgi:hypothetical protein
MNSTMKKYILSIACCTLFVLMADAQNKTKPLAKYKFSTTVNAGLLEGSSEKSFGQLQLINGLQRNTWFAGIGIGIDYYGKKRSIPLFVDIKKDFRTGKNTPFVYVDGGYNTSWLRDEEKIFSGLAVDDYKQKGGLFYEAGIGYKFKGKNRGAWGFSAGYSFKQSKESYTQFFWNEFPTFPAPSQPQQRPEMYDYKFRRISLKISCWF